MGRLSRDKRDIFYRLAKEKGYRARSAFKLLQLDAEFNIFIDPNDKHKKKIRRVVDLCAAPGSWSQVLVDKLYDAEEEEEEDDDDDGNDDAVKDDMTMDDDDDDDDERKPSAVSASSSKASSNTTTTTNIPPPPRIVAVDLQPMAPIDGVHIIQGDITSIKTAQEIIHAMMSKNSSNSSSSEGEHEQCCRAELVVCDGAPDVTGLHDVDEYLQSQLLLAALLISTHVLCVNGTFIAKIFRGPNISYMYTQLRTLFHRVSIAKPTSSRNSSMESFVVCQHFKGPPYFNLPLDIGGYVNIDDYVSRTLRANTQNLSREGNQPATRQEEERKIKNDTELLKATIPFIACGDLSGWSRPDGTTIPLILDADKSYPMTIAEHKAPIAPPMDPPYQSSIAKQKLINQTKNIKSQRTILQYFTPKQTTTTAVLPRSQSESTTRETIS